MSIRARFGATAQGVSTGPFELHGFSGPLHEQVRGLVLSRIERGDWPAGAPIPPEVQLSREFGVSIGTVRKALDQLARDRILVRERGRGTFVKEGGSWRRGPALRLCRGDGTPVDVDIRIVATDYAVATPAEITALRMLRPASITPRTLKLTRQWRDRDRLVAIETITVDAARFPNLQFEIDGGADVFFPVYAEKYHAAIDRTVWTMRPIAHGDEHARQLGTGRDVTLMRCERVAYDAKDMPLELAEQIVRFDGDLVMMARQ